MIQDTIAELEARIQRADAVKPESKAELVRLLAQLRTEITALPESHGDDAQTITAFATASTHEALRKKKDPELAQLSLQGLASSVNQLEESHPGLVQVVNRICETLANIGI